VPKWSLTKLSCGGTYGDAAALTELVVKIHHLRDNLVGRFLKWYDRKNFDPSMVEADIDSDIVLG
jgi:hypothetical protein